MEKLSNQDVDWGKHYDYYETNFRNNYKIAAKPQNLYHYSLIKAYLKKKIFNSKMISCEIGFGGGILLRKYSTIFNSVFGLDISPKNVELTAKELNLEGICNVFLEVSDIMVHENKYVNKFDIITFIHGLEHFSEMDYPKFFNNIKSYLVKDGFFTGALPYKNPFNYRMCPNCSHVFEYDGHVSSHDLMSLKKLFEENGFRILFLNNFNKFHQLKNGPIIKRIYRLIIYHILKKDSKNQIEFIAQKVLMKNSQ